MPPRSAVRGHLQGSRLCGGLPEPGGSAVRQSALAHRLRRWAFSCKQNARRRSPVAWPGCTVALTDPTPPSVPAVRSSPCSAVSAHPPGELCRPVFGRPSLPPETLINPIDVNSSLWRAATRTASPLPTQRNAFTSARDSTERQDFAFSSCDTPSLLIEPEPHRFRRRVVHRLDDALERALGSGGALRRAGGLQHEHAATIDRPRRRRGQSHAVPVPRHRGRWCRSGAPSGCRRPRPAG